MAGVPTGAKCRHVDLTNGTKEPEAATSALTGEGLLMEARLRDCFGLRQGLDSGDRSSNMHGLSRPEPASVVHVSILPPPNTRGRDPRPGPARGLPDRAQGTLEERGEGRCLNRRPASLRSDPDPDAHEPGRRCSRCPEQVFAIAGMRIRAPVKQWHPNSGRTTALESSSSCIREHCLCRPHTASASCIDSV